MYTKLDTLAENSKNSLKTNETEAYNQIINAKNNPNAEITIYRATPGKSINKGDWVFLSKSSAERWTKTTFGTPKKGFKVLSKKVKASDVGWTGKNIEFAYEPKRKKRS